MFVFDLETLDTESTAVVLSIGITHVTAETTDYQKMLDNSIFLKLGMKEQIKAGRTVDRDTCNWWDRQAQIVKDASLFPLPDDLSVADAIQSMAVWLKNQGHNPMESIFARGGMDAMAIDSLCKNFDIKCPVRYNKFYDVRTAIDFTYNLAVDGYVDVDHPTFNLGMVVKHHPVHDCAYDGMMLMYGKK